MAGERVHHEHLSPLFNHIFNPIERFGAFRKKDPSAPTGFWSLFSCQEARRARRDLIES